MKTQKNKDKQKKLLFLHILEPDILIDNFEFVSISKIKKIKKNSADKIYISDLLDHISDSETTIILNEICSKMTSGGKLYIQSSDSNCLASSLIYNNINSDIYKKILFNNNKKNIYSLGELKNIIGGIPGLKIDKCRFVNAIQYYIECYKI